MKKTLRNRPLDSSLVLINQKNYTIYGDLVITGQLIVINSILTIKGTLSILKNIFQEVPLILIQLMLLK